MIFIRKLFNDILLYKLFECQLHINVRQIITMWWPHIFWQILYNSVLSYGRKSTFLKKYTPYCLQTIGDITSWWQIAKCLWIYVLQLAQFLLFTICVNETQFEIRTLNWQISAFLTFIWSTKNMHCNNCSNWRMKKYIHKVVCVSLEKH